MEEFQKEPQIISSGKITAISSEANPPATSAPADSGDIRKDLLKNIVNNINIAEKNNFENVIDNISSIAVLSNKEEAEKIAFKKAEEIGHKTDAKVISAVADKTEAERKLIQAEAGKLEENANKARAFFNANKSVLRIIGIREELGFKTMNILYCLALPLYLLAAVLISFPISIAKFFVELVIDILGDVSKKISSNFLKVAAGILSLGISGGIIFGLYLLIVNLII